MTNTLEEARARIKYLSGILKECAIILGDEAYDREEGMVIDYEKIPKLITKLTQERNNLMAIESDRMGNLGFGSGD